jgi:tetratricopeptide (TPR) repeat protein
MTLAALLLLLAAQTSPPQDQSSSDPIIVTGDKGDPREQQAEEPYSTREHVPVGSRIPRKTGRRTFNTVASNTGLGGLLLSPGNHIEATGGTVPVTRNRLVKVCKADREEVSEETACALVEAKKKMDVRDFAGARAALQAVLAKRMLSSFDRYYAGHFAYLLAQAEGDEAGRERALRMMLASGRMAEAERQGALKSIVRMTLKRGDEAAAVTALEELLSAHPNDAESQANLATLYAWSGQHNKAVPRMQTAVSLVQQKGGTPPQTWTEYLSKQQRN